MILLRYIALLVAGSQIIPGAGIVRGEIYPNKPIRIVTSETGGGNDIPTRLIAQGISVPLGQNVIVENRPSSVTGELVSRAVADGYTLLVHGSNFWLGPLLQKTPYDPVRNFSPITLAASTPNVLVVHPSLPVKLVKDLITLAGAKPGLLNYASGSTGSSNHLAAELFKAMAGVNIVRIPYNGTGRALNGLMGGEVQLMFPNAGGATPHLKSGRLRALAVTSATPSVLGPGLPTVAASGLPGYESVNTLGIYAPVRTPAAIITRLNQEIVRFLKTPEAKEQLLNSGVEVVGSSPEQLGATMKSEILRIGKVIKDAGIKAD